MSRLLGPTRRPGETSEAFQLRSCRAGLRRMRRAHERKHPRDPVTGRFTKKAAP